MKQAINKSWSRFIAVQVLFQIDFNERMGLDISEVFNERKIIKVIKNMHSLNKNIIVFEDVEYKIDSKWLISLLKHVINNKKDLDINLSKNIDKSWSLSRMDGTLISILRCAYTEILCFNNIPTKVIISEYTNIAASFFNNKEVDFVNGILDALAQKFRSSEFIK